METRQLWEFKQVIADGYEWVDGESVQFDGKPPQKGRFLIVKRGISPLGTVTKPLDQKIGLFRKFAETTPSEEGILTFALQHGALRGPVTRYVSVNGQKEIVWGEYLWEWQSAIQQMRDLVEVWEAMRSDDTNFLSKIIQWHEKGGVRAAWMDEKGELVRGTWIAHHEDLELIARFEQPDVIRPAQYLLQKILNDKLRKCPSVPQLLWNSKYKVKGTYPRLLVYVVPDGLISALWLQFANAVVGDTQYRLCEGCGRWFALGGRIGMRSDAKACSATCRGTVHKRNKSKSKISKGGKRHAKKR